MTKSEMTTLNSGVCTDADISEGAFAYFGVSVCAHINFILLKRPGRIQSHYTNVSQRVTHFCDLEWA